MSHAGKYEELNEAIDSYIRLINAAKNNIKDLDEKIGKYLNEIKTLKEDFQALFYLNLSLKRLLCRDNDNYFKF